MRHASFICLLVVISGFFIQLVKSSFFPYMTCPGCETFLSCFFKCPRKIYPGINRYVLHNPKTTANHPLLFVHQHFFLFLRDGIYGGPIASRNQPSENLLTYLIGKIRRRSQTFQNSRVFHTYPRYRPYSPYLYPNPYLPQRSATLKL